MDVLISLAHYGPHRRRDFVTKVGRYSIDTLDVSDKSASMVRWSLANEGRGWGLALNPAFPLRTELHSLLYALGTAFPSPYRSSCTNAECKIPQSAKRRGDLELLFTSQIRTRTLLTLELLNEPAPRILMRCVPGQSMVSVKNVLRFFAAEGIVDLDKGRIRFCSQPWIPDLRALLRALGEACPKLKAQILSKMGEAGRPLYAQTDHRTALFGTFTLQRALIALAQKPRRYNELFGLVNADPSGGLRQYESMGMVISKKIGSARHYSLNRAHPAYAEFRKLLLAMSEEESQRSCSDLSARAGFSADELFAEKLRTSVLLTLEALDQQVTGFAVSRLLPEHNRAAIYAALKHFTKLGILAARGRGLKVLYALNPLYVHHRQLKSLLHATNERWSHWRHGAAAEPYLRHKRVRRMASSAKAPSDT